MRRDEEISDGFARSARRRRKKQKRKSCKARREKERMERENNIRTAKKEREDEIGA